MIFGGLPSFEINDSHLVAGSRIIELIRRSILENGYAVVDGVTDTNRHFKLAGCLGQIRRNSLGTFVHTLSVKDESDAQRNSLSAVYGRGAFPYHTDTASWAIPIRHIMLRAAGGDVRRSTRVVKFNQLLEGISESILRRACWMVKNGAHSFYAGILWRGQAAEETRYRLDFGCMKPKNATALALESDLKKRCSSEIGLSVEWRHGRVLVLNNWLMLHARSGAIADEGERVLERIYLS